MVLISGKWYTAPQELNGSSMLPIFLVIFGIILVKQIREKNFNFKKIILLFSFLTYMWFLLDITLFPIPVFSLNAAPYKLGLGKQVFINWRLDTLNTYLPLQLVGNILLLAPMSFFVAVFDKKYSYFRNNLFLMFLFTLCIESVQLIFSYFYLGNRTFDVNDLVLNTFGSILGFAFFKIMNFFFEKEIIEVRSKKELSNEEN